MSFIGKSAKWAGRAGVFAANPMAGTALGVGEASIRAGRRLRGGVQKAARGNMDDAAWATTQSSRNPVARARTFAHKRPGTTAALGAAMVAPAIYSGGPGSGSRISKRNQNSYYVRQMRSGQSSGIAGITANSLGGLA